MTDKHNASEEQPMKRMLLRELVVQYRRRERLRSPPDGLKTSKDVYEMFKDMARYPRERMVVVLLDNRCRLIGWETVSMGTNKASLAEASQVYQAALLTGACSVILIHNHPSGLAEPSEEDRRVTLRLKYAGDLVGVTLADHIIIGADGYYSFNDKGELSTP